MLWWVLLRKHWPPRCFESHCIEDKWYAGVQPIIRRQRYANFLKIACDLAWDLVQFLWTLMEDRQLTVITHRPFVGLHFGQNTISLTFFLTGKSCVYTEEGDRWGWVASCYSQTNGLSKNSHKKFSFNTYWILSEIFLNCVLSEKRIDEQPGR